MKQRFRVGGMSCAACSAHVEKSVSAVPGVREVQVNLLAGSMVVEYDEGACSDAQIIRAVEEGGYTAAVDSGTRAAAPAKDSAPEDDLHEMKNRILISAVFLIILMYFSMGPMIGLPLPGFVSGTEHAFALALVQLLLTLPILHRQPQVFYQRLQHAAAPRADDGCADRGRFGRVAWCTAFTRCSRSATQARRAIWRACTDYAHDLYFESAGMILTLVTLGKFFEARAKRKTGEAIAALMDLRPQTASVLRGGQEVTVPIEDVRVGDLVVVRGGQSVPVDGEIAEGNAYLDESAITGESPCRWKSTRATRSSALP